ncbi:MAG: hypothetical protein NT045_09415 [Candidatus Aureabacteria bacterium]|nr:hypothetical protein [Candidatus Auribacterota bacterium]
MNTDTKSTADRQREDTLVEEIEQFKREKERVRAIVGRIGGVPTFRDKLFNVLFSIGVAACFAISIATHGRLVLPMIEIGVVLISVKIIYLLHTYSRQMHFMFWVLSSIEWKLNEMAKHPGER